MAKNAKEMVGGTFLCVRVEVDISKPLCRGRKVGIIEDSEIWVAFKYEKLPNFCYWCGMVSHTDKDCDVWIGSKGKLRHEQQGYGNCFVHYPSIREMAWGVHRTMTVAQ